jgi:phenylalanyl-tRNA synthetase alpha chain
VKSPDNLDAIITEAQTELKAPLDANTLEELRIKYLGRKGIVAGLIEAIPHLPKDERAAYGKKVNAFKKQLADTIRSLQNELTQKRPKEVFFDVTRPGTRVSCGKKHILTQTMEEIMSIFQRLGFSVATGPEVEEEFYNFDALNIGPEHPARDRADNFYIQGKDNVSLRAQTSTIQARVLTKRKPPVRIMGPGRVYRPDTVDASHLFQFTQIEGLAVDEGITMGDLKYVLHIFAREFFGKDVKIRFRPHFFPFTEPSVEVDVSCIICDAKGCSTCGGKGWSEILGAGMVDPNLFEVLDIDKEKYTGFAFGIGIERTAIQKYGIDDIRHFYENDIGFLSQF